MVSNFDFSLLLATSKNCSIASNGQILVGYRLPILYQEKGLSFSSIDGSFLSSFIRSTAILNPSPAKFNHVLTLAIVEYPACTPIFYFIVRISLYKKLRNF